MKDQYNNVQLLAVESIMPDFHINILWQFIMYLDQLFLDLIKPCLIKFNLKAVADAVG